MKTPSLTERIEKVLALNAKRTSGEWKHERCPTTGYDGQPREPIGEITAHAKQHQDGFNYVAEIVHETTDGEFIAAAPEMIAIIREQKAELERLRLYARHSDNCLRGPGDCTCGLTK